MNQLCRLFAKTSCRIFFSFSTAQMTRAQNGNSRKLHHVLTSVKIDHVCLETDAPDQWPDLDLTLSDMPRCLIKDWTADPGTKTTEPWMVHIGYHSLYAIRQQEGLDEGLDYRAFQDCISQNALASLGIIMRD